ncbi:MAG: hypothetical protein JWM57_2539 [Phycisphaerales bacterium]|nr:hypothetical protein [Phycisphaerales bacterium]
MTVEPPPPIPPLPPTLPYASPMPTAAPSQAIDILALLLRAAAVFIGIVLLSAGLGFLTFGIMLANHVREDPAAATSIGLGLCTAGLSFFVVLLWLRVRRK